MKFFRFEKIITHTKTNSTQSFLSILDLLTLPLSEIYPKNIRVFSGFLMRDWINIAVISMNAIPKRLIYAQKH